MPETTNSTTVKDPKVEVYDTDGNDSTATRDTTRTVPTAGPETTTTPTSTTYRDPGAGRGVNWSAIIIGTLVILALIVLFIWIF